MMARSMRRNGMALSRRWKLGGEDNRNAGGKKKGGRKERKGDSEEEVWEERAVVERVLLVTRFFRCAWYRE
jgi:hypothetical protein